MRQKDFDRIRRRYGQEVELHGQEGEPVRVRAFVQPIREQGEDRWQVTPTPLGLRRRERFLYLGPAEPDLEEMREGWLVWSGRKWEIQSCQPVWLGGEVLYQWAVLRPRGA